MPATIVQLSPSKRGTRETLAAMMLLATDPRTTPRIRFEALKLVGHLPTPEARTRALFRWVRATVTYVSDAPVFEHVQRPWSLPGDEFPGLFELALARSPAAAGDCFVYGTKVLRREGHALVDIETLKEGDEIWGLDRWSRVTKTWEKGVLPTTKIKLNNGSYMRLTESHKVWIAICREHPRSHRLRRPCSCRMDARDVRRIEVSDLEPGMVVLQPERIPCGTDTMDVGRAYIEGLYISDGWSENGRFSISGQDGCRKEQQKREVEAICSRLGIATRWARKYIAVNDREWLPRIKEMGDRARFKRAPDINLDGHASAELLRGIMADSGRNTNGSGATFTTTSPELWLQTRVLLKMHGKTCSSSKIVDHGGLGKHPIYRLGVRDDTRTDASMKLLRVKAITRDGAERRCFDIETDDHMVWLPEADWTTSQCDDHSVLMAALCHALGQDVRLVVTETYESSPEWEHVHAETNIAGPYEPERWVAVDTSLSWLEFGETHKGVSAEAVYSSDLDALGAHERLALGQAAEGGGPWDLLRGVIEFGGQLIRGAMTQRGLDRQAAAIREAGQLQSETQRLIGERRVELQTAYGALNAEREGFWGAREEAQRRLFWERLKGPAGAGLALAGLVAVGWATARRSRPRRRNGRRRHHGSQVSRSRRR